jgi:hypothetical protein
MIRDGVVDNVSLWDGDTNKWQPPEGITCIPAPDEIGIGFPNFATIKSSFCSLYKPNVVT